MNLIINIHSIMVIFLM